MDLGVDTLRNRDHSLIFSAGDLFIGGKLNHRFVIAENAKWIEDQNATIEALGNGAILAERLVNEDRYLTLGTKYNYDKHEVYTPLNSSAKYYGNAGKDGQGWIGITIAEAILMPISVLMTIRKALWLQEIGYNTPIPEKRLPRRLKNKILPKS